MKGKHNKKLEPAELRGAGEGEAGRERRQVEGVVEDADMRERVPDRCCAIV